jgi:uncharacterized protein YhaN
MALRIERLDFSPWGCFEDFSLSFSPKIGDVDLVHGPNAAGKSTISRGERSLLYGIEARTPDNHTFDYADLRIGARLALDGGSVELARLKRRVGSLVALDGEPLGDDPIPPALGGLTEEVYRALFQVDHDTLVQGGAELLQGQGEVGASLFAAAAGIATLHDTLAALDGEAERVFNPRGRATILHKALAELREAEKHLRVTTLRPARHREMTRELGKEQEACDELSGRMRELELEVREIERKRALAPLLDRHSERAEELARLAATPDLEPDAAARRADAQGRVGAGSGQLKRAQDAISRLAAEIDAVDVDDAMLARADEIRGAYDDVSTMRKAAADRRKREGELEEANAGLRGAAATIGVDPGAVESLRRPASARRALDELLREHGELAARRRAADARLAEATAEQEEAGAALDLAEPLPDVGPLAAATTGAVKAGSLSTQLSEATAQAARDRELADQRLRRLVPAPATMQLLRVLAAPTRDQIARARQEATEVEDAVAELRADCARVAQAEKQLVEERDQLELAGSAPTAQELSAARTTRDELWTGLRGGFEAGSVPQPTEAIGFELAAAEADRVADARTAGAAQIERAASMQARAQGLERERDELGRRQEALDVRAAAAARSWEDTWACTGLAEIRPQDALAWLEERDRILELDRSATEAEAKAEVLRQRQAVHVEALRARLQGLGAATPDDTSLDELIARSQALIDEARERAKARVTAEATLKAAERALAAARREAQAVAAARKAWEAAWPERRDDAGLPAAATPQAAQEIVRAVDEGLGHLGRIADLSRRIEGIDRDRASFDARVRTLCDELAPQLAALDAARAAPALHALLGEHEQSRSRRDSLIEQRATAESDLEVVAAEIAAAQAEIDALVAAAGCTQADELPEIERRAARAQALRDELAEIERQVAEVGEGRFDTLAAGAASIDRGAAALEADELREQIEELREGRDELKEQIGQRKRELHEAETDTAAVRAAEDVELARARVLQAAVAHAKAKLSGAVVRRAIERYRRLHQDPLLHRADGLFGRFTLGSFVELLVDVDDRGQAILVGRQRDRVRKRVHEMSTGTREQLFLALRIAAIERYVETSGPVPVLFDDVFLESDEPRSERIFDALGELAAKTQVIVLTHHHHLIDVGKRALADRLVVQDLPDAAPLLRPAAAA